MIGGIFISTFEEKAKENLQIAWWDKYTLSIPEASAYFGINDKKFRKFVEEHENEKFILWNGTRPRIKRKLFEKYIDEELMAI